MNYTKLTHLNEMQERSENWNKPYNKYSDAKIGASAVAVRQKKLRCFWSKQKAGSYGE